MKVWEEILQRTPTWLFFWISTKGPTFVPSPTEHPYRFTRSGWVRTVSAPSWAFAFRSGIGRNVYERGTCRNTVTGVLPTNKAFPSRQLWGRHNARLQCRGGHDLV